MRTIKTLLLGVTLLSIMQFQSCFLFKEDCSINPDLISDLLAPSTDIIAGEPVDWDYVIKSIEDNSQDCNILKAGASIGKITIKYFVDQIDIQGDEVYNIDSNINELSAGKMQTVSNEIDVFNQDGIFLISTNADNTQVVAETNEFNNNDSSTIDTRISSQIDIFSNASIDFLTELEKSAAIVIVGTRLENYMEMDSYKNKAIYYAKY